MASYNILNSTTIKGPSIALKELHVRFSSSLSFPTSKDSSGSSSSSRSCLTSINQYLTQQAEPTSVSQKVRALDSEFRSLPEPIDRVKRLLHYATLLPRFDESLRTTENRVPGCAAQVWLQVRMDRDGAMRFGVDSDSEITKGFCSRLIWLFDGAEADEVLGVRCDDLVEMNVGFPMKGSSRVNAWISVLDVMQRRTKALVEQRRRRTRDLPV